MYATIIAQEADDQVTLEIVDDRVQGTSSELLVRNFVPKLKALQVDAGPAVHIRLNTTDSFIHLRGLPRAVLQVDTSGEDEAGEAIHWTSEVDFGKFQRATLLVMKDPYGRIRPRVISDTAPEPVESAK